MRNSDNYDTMEFQAIRPENPMYQALLANGSDFKDFNQSTPETENYDSDAYSEAENEDGYTYEDDYPYENNYPYEDDYAYEDNYSPEYDSNKFASSVIIVIVALFAVLAISVAIIAFAIFGNDDEKDRGVVPVTTSTSTSVNEVVSTTPITKNTEASTKAETSTTEATTETTTKSETTTTSATTTTAEAQPITTTLSETAPPAPTEVVVPPAPTETEIITNQPEPSEIPTPNPDEFDWDPEIDGIQFAE